MRTCLSTLFVLLTPLLFAQQRVPEIPFDSVPDFPQTACGLEFGRSTRRSCQFQGPCLRLHPLQYGRRSGLCVRRRRNCSSSAPTASS